MKEVLSAKFRKEKIQKNIMYFNFDLCMLLCHNIIKNQTSDYVNRTLISEQMSMKEMPMIPSEVAIARQCSDAGELAMTRKYLIRDAKAESQPARTTAFGTTMPLQLQFIPPKNRVKEKWLQCENVMSDLETMDVVWKGITHLESVRAFLKWLQEHPDVSYINIISLLYVVECLCYCTYMYVFEKRFI